MTVLATLFNSLLTRRQAERMIEVLFLAVSREMTEDAQRPTLPAAFARMLGVYSPREIASSLNTVDHLG